MVIYLIGSLRNPQIPLVASALREDGHDVYDDWYAVGPDADEYWRVYEMERGRSFTQAINGWHAHHVFENDKYHLDACDAGLLVAPAGRSAHLEIGYLAGCGKETYVLLDEEPERFDIMYRFVTGIYDSLDKLRANL